MELSVSANCWTLHILFQNSNIWQVPTCPHSPHSSLIAAFVEALFYSFSFKFNRLSNSQSDYISIFSIQRFFSTLPCFSFQIHLSSELASARKSNTKCRARISREVPIINKTSRHFVSFYKKYEVMETWKYLYFGRAGRWAIHRYSSIAEISTAMFIRTCRSLQISGSI